MIETNESMKVVGHYDEFTQQQAREIIGLCLPDIPNHLA
jgi:hypothetical protein